MAEDKKDLKPEEQGQSGPAVSEAPAPRKEEPPAQEVKTSAPVQEAEKADTPAAEKTDTPGPADRSRPGNVIDISGAMIDKIVAEKEKAAMSEQEQGSTTDKPKPERTDAAKPEKKKQTARSQKDKAPKQTEKSKVEKTSPSKQEEEKAAPAADGPSREEQKAKLEQELRKKYGIPKTDKPVEPFVIPEVEQTVRIPHEQLHAFKNHPFNVEKNAKFMAFVSSIRAQGVTQPAIVRPDDKGGYEIISGHRRDAGSIEAGIPYTPCIIRALTDEQAIQQMVEDNVNNREVSTMELAKALKMQLEAIKHQGAREALEGQNFSTDVDKRSNEVIAERNGMSVKQVQRHIALTRLIPPLQDMVDGKTVGSGGKPLKIAFTPAVELSYIKPKNQRYIAVAIDAQQSAPSLSQAQRMRKLDQENMLNGDVIDGIMLEEKKEVDKVIISGMELEKYFGKEKTPQEMKDQIIKLLDDWKGKQKEQTKPEKKAEQEK
ncbi:ParB/RepB/Spo0J family partition protein [uncultured Clostridium sp.]|uniref:ParB/RepB/Spo0J family partition protein n=1 Tax=uncultured Clostridium sp. TaxID=59620 RepID=UPI0025CFA001|nr:ParB/RepB/Spo0J family partition protein [uncultured Clostridium sp.]